MEVRTIAFEGLDGSGKDTSIDELALLIDCEKWETPEETKELRSREISEQDGETDELYEFFIQSYQSEWADMEKRLSTLPPGKVMLLNRCWVTPASYRSAVTGEVPEWPREFKPDVIFTIRVDEELRRERISAPSRPKLKHREKRTLEDHDYREGQQRAELELGCTPLRIRDREPEVVAMRALQHLLGLKGFTYTPRKK